MTSCRVDIPAQLKQSLFAHLFPGDGDEHAAVLAASMTGEGSNLRLLVRHVLLAEDGADYVAGVRGYRHLRGEFVQRCITFCREQRLAYIAVHNHAGTDRVAFSSVDRASHARGYPALLDLMRGLPVGAMVFAQRAAAGELWLTNSVRIVVEEFRVIGHTIERLTPEPRRITSQGGPEQYNRQVLLFGELGQEILKNSVIGVIGVGGAGSLISEYLARLGVGRIVVVDPDRIESSNLSRVVGATRWNTRWPFSSENVPGWIRRIAEKLSARKVEISKRVAKQANPRVRYDAIAASVVKASAADALKHCDFLFLAADTASARLVFNALVHQYYIPGIQVGAKIRADQTTGELLDAFSVMRWILPGFGCLWCTGLISPHKLALEAKTDSERARQQYGSESPDPSVITLNAIAASHAVNECLFALTGLRRVPDTTIAGVMWHHHSQKTAVNGWKAPEECSECGHHEASRFGRGDSVSLPISN
jgi:hypothetical protein